jgi:hypothetical protein
VLVSKRAFTFLGALCDFGLGHLTLVIMLHQLFYVIILIPHTLVTPGPCTASPSPCSLFCTPSLGRSSFGVSDCDSLLGVSYSTARARA